MKKEFSVPLPILILLIVLLVVSFVFNLLQYTWADAPNHRNLIGTYQFEYGDLYIVMERDDIYRIYSQADGLLEEGHYGNYNRENQYCLEGTSGEGGVVLFQPEEDGVFYVNDEIFGGLPEVLFFRRISDTPTYLGEWAQNHDFTLQPAA